MDKRSSLCPSESDGPYEAGSAIVGSLTFKKLVIIIGWVCFGLTVFLWLALVIPHLRRYKLPNEQRQMFRIVTTPLVYSLFGLIAVQAYRAAPYLEAVPELYEAYALASVFLLYVHYVAPEAHNREEFFHSLEFMSKPNSKPGKGLRWFKRSWRIIFFYILIMTILFLLEIIFIATGRYCSTSGKPKHGHIWITVLQLILTIWALIVVIRFQRRLKTYMAGRNAFMKLVSFKLFILVTTLQNFIFNILKTVVHGTATLTYQDLTIGLPTLLLTIEGMLFMASFHFTFHSREYKSHMASPGDRQGIKGMAKALLHALNPTDLVEGVWWAFKSFFMKKTTTTTTLPSGTTTMDPKLSAASEDAQQQEHVVVQRVEAGPAAAKGLVV